MVKLKDALRNSNSNLYQDKKENKSSLNKINIALIKSLDGVNAILEEGGSLMKDLDNSMNDYLEKNKKEIERKKKLVEEHKNWLLKR